MPEVLCRNLYVEADKSEISPDKTLRIQRPGLTTSVTLPGVIRGLDTRVATGETITIAGTTLYSGAMAMGTVGGEGITPMIGTTFVYAVLGGSTVYLYNTTVTPLVMPDDAGEIVDIEQLNQYLLILTRSGKFYWMEPGATTVDPLNFATAESSPDMARAIRRIGDEFWIFGDDTIEPWQSSGDVDAPFQRAAGRIYERGCLERDTVKRFDNSVMWVSDDAQVCRGGAVPQVVSDNGIAERIRLRGGDLSAWVFGLDGHEFYCLRIPGQGTYAYDALTQQWCEFASLGRSTWGPYVGFDRGGVVTCGDANSGKVWVLDPEAGTDDGLPIERIVTATVGIMGRAGRNDSISIGVGSSADCVIRVRWKDGQDDYPDYFDGLDARSPFDVVNLYRLGQPQQPYRTLEVSCLDTARIRIAGAMFGEAWQ